jgi:hypothetical protein
MAAGMQPKPSFQAILFAVMLSAVISLPEQDVLADYAISKSEFVDHFRQATEAALSRANLLRTTKIETLQAFVMYLVCENEWRVYD